MRNLMIFLFLPMIIRAEAGKNSNSLSPQTLLVECPANVTISEGQKYDTSVTGFPKVVMNDGGAVTISYIEIFSKGNCSNRNDLVTRIFTIRNAIGNTERCTQSIYISFLTPSQLRLPTDTTLNYPRDKTLSQAITGFGPSLGALDVSFIDTKVSNMCNVPVKIKREWSIMDRCSGTVVKRTTNITLNDYQYSFDQNKSTVTHLCGAEGEISLSPKGEFAPYTYQWNTGATTRTITNLTAGNYSAVITDGFKCTQLNSTTLTNMSETGDVGGLIATANSIRVYPDSINIKDLSNIDKFCVSQNGGLQYGFKLKKKNTGFMEYNFVKRSQILDGLNTKDIIIIQKHILGKQLITDPLLLIAADVNANFNVASSDIAEIRKLLLGVIHTFQKVLPWYFYRPDWMSGGNALFQGVTLTTFPKFNADVLALKMGDVDLSYREPGYVLQSRNITPDQDVFLDYKLRQGTSGTEVDIYLHALESKISGFQGSWTLPSTIIKAEVINSQLPSDAFFISQNELRISHSTGDLLEWKQNTPILTLRIHQNLDAQESADLFRNSNFIEPRYFDLDLNEYYLEFRQTGSGQVQQVLCFPNPADHFIEIMYPGNVINTLFEVFDQSGKLVLKENHNTVIFRVDVQGLSQGIYYYRASEDDQMVSGGFFFKK
ncbi:MAG: T9SS type A sorting domain-containing protein [Saprospiraceae bacterium]|nr:T9SS type A sorting domain-containing protein [Saprospiraceae bacterium]HMW40326.1 T9SS type A sorting domain-containing protein [Saprospiraceae bacterium]HMX88262.1 T9SS type A sorting domain-containing protein [Saprospiraceae bacterium]HMZ40723.1 T9SS type A sorting domain-containing protein [Saprospiraceae bacterium]HNA65258.1 T9SS type A sorting domain-containing protein [Saprospiraceae bacterium]